MQLIVMDSPAQTVDDIGVTVECACVHHCKDIADLSPDHYQMARLQPSAEMHPRSLAL